MADGRPLGSIAIKSSARPDTGFAGSLLDGDAVKNVNREAIRPFELDFRQWERWALQATARKVLDHDKRLSRCCRWLLGGQAQVIRAETGQCSYGGVETCGSVWRCPICASKIAQRRRAELAQLVDRHVENGGSVALVTRTFPHTAWDRLEVVLDKFRDAEQRFKAGRAWQELRKMVGLVGTVRALEVTYGENGFHPHGHELWLIDCDEWKEDREYREDVQDMSRALWARVCERAGLPLPGWEVGLTIQGGRRAVEYVAKFGEETGGSSWGIEDELTKLHTKKGRGKGLTPWDLLRLVLEGDEEQARDASALFKEYAAAFRGRRQLWWSQGLREVFGLGDELTDEELAQQAAEGFVLGDICFEDWRRIVRADAQFAVLQAAQESGWPGVVAVLEGLRNGEACAG